MVRVESNRKFKNLLMKKEFVKNVDEILKKKRETCLINFVL